MKINRQHAFILVAVLVAPLLCKVILRIIFRDGGDDFLGFVMVSMLVLTFIHVNDLQTKLDALSRQLEAQRKSYATR